MFHDDERPMRGDISGLQGGFEAIAPFRALSEHRKVALQHAVGSTVPDGWLEGGSEARSQPCKVARYVFTGVNSPLFPESGGTDFV